jgi:hypothetical protein
LLLLRVGELVEGNGRLEARVAQLERGGATAGFSSLSAKLSRKSRLCDSAQQRNRLGENRLFFRRQRLRDCRGEPAFSTEAITRKGLLTGIRDYNQCLAAVKGVASALDEAARLEICDRLGHRLRPDKFGGGECASRAWAFAGEAAEDDRLRDRKSVFGAETANETPHRHL